MSCFVMASLGQNVLAGDNQTVACGGKYSSYQHSYDGSSVCCGGEYSSYQVSYDGSSVCAGGQYSGYKFK